jgi:hypothetical protein
MAYWMQSSSDQAFWADRLKPMASHARERMIDL